MAENKKMKVVKVKTSDHNFKKIAKNKITKKIDANKKGKKSQEAWIAVSFFGMIGFGIAIPVLAGAVFGDWLSLKFPNSQYPLALYGILAGISAGMYNAFKWIKEENTKLNKKNKK